MAQPPQRNLPPESSEWAKWVERNLLVQAQDIRSNYSQIRVVGKGAASNFGNTIKIQDRIDAGLEELWGSLLSLESMIVENAVETADLYTGVTTADGKITVSSRDPQPEDGLEHVEEVPADPNDPDSISYEILVPAKPVGAIWEVRDSAMGESIRRFIWDGEEWHPYVIGPEFMADEIIDATKLTEEVRGTIEEAHETATDAAAEARDAKDATVQNADDILTLNNAQNVIAADVRDAWNDALEALELAKQGGNNLYPDPSFELGGEGLNLAGRAEIVESPLARHGDYVLKSLVTISGQFGQPEEYLLASQGDTFYCEFYVMRTSAAQTGTVAVRVQTVTDSGTSGTSSVASRDLAGLALNTWHKISGTFTMTSDRVGIRFYPYMSNIGGTGVLFDSVKVRDVTSAQQALAAAQAAADDAAKAAESATQALVAADGKTRIWKSTKYPASSNTTGAVGDVWWRYANAGFTGPVIGQWTRNAEGADGWTPTQIRSEVIESLTVDKLSVTGGAKIPVAVIDSLVTDDAYLSSVYANRVVVDAQNYAPGPGGYEGVYTLGSSTGFVNTSQDPTGRAFLTSPMGASIAARDIAGPKLPVTPGQTITFEFNVYRSTTDIDGDLTLGMRFYDADGARISTQWAWRGNTAGDKSGTVTVPSGAVTGAFRVYSYKGTQGTYNVRRLVVRPQVGPVLIENGAVVADKIAADAVTTDKIKAGSITAASGILANLAVTTAKIANLAVTGAKIADATIGSAKIIDASIGSAQIALASIENGHIKNLSANKITSGYISANRIQAGTIAGSKLAATAIDGKTITGATIQTVSAANRGVKITSDGLRAWNSSGDLMVEITGTSNLLSGTFRTGAGAGIHIRNSPTTGLPFLYLSSDGSMNSNQAAIYVDDTYGLHIRGRTQRGVQANPVVHGITVPSGRNVYVFYNDRNAGIVLSAETDNGRVWANNITSAQNMYIASPPTSTFAANLGIASSPAGRFYKITSLRKFKLDIEPIEKRVDPYSILDVPVEDRVDRTQMEEYAEALEYDALKKEGFTLKKDTPFSPQMPRRIPGVVAENVEAAGLERFCTYNEAGELDGIMYDRLPLLLIPVVKELVERIDYLEEKCSMLEN